MLPGGQVCAIQLLEELREPIAPLVMTDFVFQPPKEGECRNGQQEMSAWLQHAAQLAQSREIVLHVLYYIGCKNQIEAAITERQRAHIAQLYLPKAFLGTEPDCLRTLVDTDYPGEPEIANHPHILAGPRAAFQVLHS